VERNLRSRGADLRIVDLRRVLGEPRTCYLCGDELGWPDATVDHILAVSRGGEHAVGNLDWVHRLCNDMKSTMTVTELYERARRVVAHLGSTAS